MIHNIMNDMAEKDNARSHIYGNADLVRGSTSLEK